jgi:hypothetical protein
MSRPRVLALVLAVACRSHSDAGQVTSGASAVAGTPASDIWHKDPCQLLSRHDAEIAIGPLLHDPYRADDDHITADSAGGVCLYRAADGHSVEVSATWLDGKTKIKMYTQGLLPMVLADDKGKADTLSDVWDEAAVQIGTLYALKADTLVEINYAASGLSLIGATKLAEAAIGRLGKPLAYNGAAATHGVPGPLVTPRDPCSALTRAEVERVLGRLTADPASAHDHCTYATAAGLVRLDIEWTNGFRQLFEDRGAERNAASLVTKQFQPMLAPNGTAAAVPSHDSASVPDTVTGPWTDSHRSGRLEVVKKDVYMRLYLEQIRTDQAIALLTMAMSKI